MPPSEHRANLAQRIDTIEASYEFMLGYAAKGVAIVNGHAEDGQVREYLRRFDEALTGLGTEWRAAVASESLEPADEYKTFIDVLERDAARARAGIRLVLGQPAIGSQLVDNLNASQHVRAVLTDLFLLDELLNPHVVNHTPSSP